jgi:hypothetical protein
MKTNGTVMQETLDMALVDGQIPWQANLAAIRKYDIFDDLEGGTVEAKKMVSGIDVFIARLEVFKDVAEQVARRSASIHH